MGRSLAAPGASLAADRVPCPDVHGLHEPGSAHGKSPGGEVSWAWALGKRLLAGLETRESRRGGTNRSKSAKTSAFYRTNWMVRCALIGFLHVY